MAADICELVTSLYVANSVQDFSLRNLAGSVLVKENVNAASDVDIIYGKTGPEDEFYVGNHVVCDKTESTTCIYKVLFFTTGVQVNTVQVTLTGYSESTAPPVADGSPSMAPVGISNPTTSPTVSPTENTGEQGSGWELIVVPIVGVGVGLCAGVLFWTWLLRKKNEKRKQVKFATIDVARPLPTGSAMKYIGEENETDHTSYAWNDDRDSTLLGNSAGNVKRVTAEPLV